MDSNHVFLCGVMWCKLGQVDVGKELAEQRILRML
jgi:hypothetical protein